MKHTVIERVGRLISSAAHQLVDSAEGLAPEAIMEQAIREIEGAIQEMEVSQGEAIARRHIAQTRLNDENTRHNDLDEQCRIALEKGRRDLAETAMSQMLDIEAQIPVLEREISTAEDERVEIAGAIAALNGKRNEMREELRRMRTAARAAGAPSPDSGVDKPGNDARSRARKATDVFDRAMERATGLPGGAPLPGTRDAINRAELEELRRQHRIDERLREMLAGQ